MSGREENQNDTQTTLNRRPFLQSAAVLPFPFFMTNDENQIQQTDWSIERVAVQAEDGGLLRLGPKAVVSHLEWRAEEPYYQSPDYWDDEAWDAVATDDEWFFLVSVDHDPDGEGDAPPLSSAFTARYIGEGWETVESVRDEPRGRAGGTYRAPNLSGNNWWTAPETVGSGGSATLAFRLPRESAVISVRYGRDPVRATVSAVLDESPVFST